VAAQAVQAVVNAPDADWDEADDADVEISYHDDEPAPANEEAFQDDADPAPAEAAVVPSPEESAVAKPISEEAFGGVVSADGAEGAEAVVTPAPPQVRRDIIVKLP